VHMFVCVSVCVCVCVKMCLNLCYDCFCMCRYTAQSPGGGPSLIFQSCVSHLVSALGTLSTASALSVYVCCSVLNCVAVCWTVLQSVRTCESTFWISTLITEAL